MKERNTLDEVREARNKISQRFEYDPGRLVAYYKKKQRQLIANQKQPPSSARVAETPSDA